MLSKSVIKDIQSLQHKKFRDASGLFVAEGAKLVNELVMAKNFAVETIYATAEWPAGDFAHAYPFECIADFELEKISGLSTPNKVMAVLRQKNSNANFKTINQITLVLDGIRDPGNLGTIIRIADWFGVPDIVCSQDTADLYNPKVVQSTMASLGRVNVLYTPLQQWLQQQAGVKKLAAVLNEKPLEKMGPLTAAIIIIGNESTGVSPELIQLADACISITAFGKAESLNAAVATGIILHAMRTNGTV